MSYTDHFFLLCSGYAAAVAIGYYSFRQYDLATRIFTLMLTVQLAVELIAYFVQLKYHNNLRIYRANNAIEIASYSIYFNYSVDILRRNRIGLWLAGIGAIVCAALAFIYPEDLHGSRFFISEGIAIICLSLLALFRMLMAEEDLSPARNIHFWLASGVCIFWCLTYFSFVAYSFYQYPKSIDKLNMILNFIGNWLLVLFTIYAMIRFRRPYLPDYARA